MLYKNDTKLKLILILGFIATLVFAIDALSYPVSTQLSIIVFEVIAAVTLFYINLKRDGTIELDQSRQNKIFGKRLKKTTSLSEQEFIRASFLRAEWRGKQVSFLSVLLFLIIFHLIFWLFFALLKLGRYLSDTLGFFGDIFGIVVMLVVLGLIVALVSQSKETK